MVWREMMASPFGGVHSLVEHAGLQPSWCTPLQPLTFRAWLHLWGLGPHFCGLCPHPSVLRDLHLVTSAVFLFLFAKRRSRKTRSKEVTDLPPHRPSRNVLRKDLGFLILLGSLLQLPSENSEFFGVIWQSLDQRSSSWPHHYQVVTRILF